MKVVRSNIAMIYSFKKLLINFYRRLYAVRAQTCDHCPDCHNEAVKIDFKSDLVSI